MKKISTASASGAVYTRSELMAAAPRFGTTPEMVAGAMRRAGKAGMTLAEAEQAIQNFLGR